MAVVRALLTGEKDAVARIALLAASARVAIVELVRAAAVDLAELIGVAAALR